MELLPFNSAVLPWLTGETLFSLCSRHHRLWGFSNSSQSTEILFGSPRRGTQHDFPCALDVFADRTQGLLGSANEIARQRTVLKFYAPFRGAGEVQDAVVMMRSASVAHLKYRLGLLTSRFRARITRSSLALSAGIVISWSVVGSIGEAIFNTPGSGCARSTRFLCRSRR